ncbi:TPA: hypothetical protein RQK80_003871 [Vibrio vulnificus]|nr:hypothetical protein [Vibrio vulnificus]HDY8043419.1 hypothetical protein [Vibrio vulnificus]
MLNKLIDFVTLKYHSSTANQSLSYFDACIQFFQNFMERNWIWLDGEVTLQSRSSSVNNCTRQQKVQVSTQLTRLLQPDRAKGSGKDHFDEEMSITALLKGSSLRIDDETSLEIRPAEVDEYGNVIRPALLAEVRREAEDLRWLNFKGWDKVFAEPEAPEHQQPNLPFFGGEVPAAKTWSEYQALIEENDWPLV